MKELTSDHISHLASLARLELDGEEKARFAEQLSSVVGYVEQLSEVDTSAAQGSWGVTGTRNVFMEDEARPETDLCAVPKEDLLNGAPARNEDFIEVRAVMGDEIVSA